MYFLLNHDYMFRSVQNIIWPSLHNFQNKAKIQCKLYFILWDPLCVTVVFFSPGATTPIGGCILQPSSGL